MTHVAIAGLLLCTAMACPEPGPDPVRPGLEVLVDDSLHFVRGRAVGLLTNAAAVDRAGVPAVDRLRAAGVRLVALFSPEHGFRVTAEPGEHVATTVDSATGLPIYSLYGTHRAPTDEMLRGIDVLLVDLTDVGVRYYTYLGTTLETMRSAVRAGIPVVVLDRPNPIGGRLVQGNVVEPAYRSFIGVLEMPMRHGLTLGELARLGNAELGIGADLAVVPAAGWRRADDLEATGLPFRAPSPNLRDLDGLYHYAGVCLFEGTALSVGRGTSHPFHQIGAPWLDVPAILERVSRTDVPGVRFEAVRFVPRRPGDAKFDGVALAGIRLVLTDRAAYDPTWAALVLLDAVQVVHPDRIGWIPRHFDLLAGSDALRAAIQAGRPPAEIARSWAGAVAAFRERSAPFLLYR